MMKSSTFVHMGFTDVEGSRAVARRLFETYDRDKNGNIDKVEVVPMIVDAYKAFNRSINPTRADIDAYYKVLDANGDGKVSIEDIEQVCFKFLLGSDKKDLKPKGFTAEVESRLDMARRLYKKYDKNYKGYLEEAEAIDLLAETYKSLGLETYFPTKDDIKAWMQMTNPTYKGNEKISLPEYEALIIKSLKRAGFKMEYD